MTSLMKPFAGPSRLIAVGAAVVALGATVLAHNSASATSPRSSGTLGSLQAAGTADLVAAAPGIRSALGGGEVSATPVLRTAAVETRLFVGSTQFCVEASHSAGLNSFACGPVDRGAQPGSVSPVVVKTTDGYLVTGVATDGVTGVTIDGSAETTVTQGHNTFQAETSEAPRTIAWETGDGHRREARLPDLGR